MFRVKITGVFNALAYRSHLGLSPCLVSPAQLLVHHPLPKSLLDSTPLLLCPQRFQSKAVITSSPSFLRP